MIGVTFCGRLGNQLFQFYFFQYVKAVNKRKLVIIPNPGHAYLYKYFDLGKYNYIGSKPYKYLTYALYKFGMLRKEVYIQNNEVPKPFTAQNGTMYHGFHQTEWYLKNTPNPVMAKIKKQYVKAFNQKYGAIFSSEKTIVVHIRRTDYLTYGKRDISLPIEHFKRQLAAIKDADDHRVFFCSDDMEFVRQHFEQKSNYIFSQDSEIMDFQLLMNADTVIISNSTFAWWAAYMCPKQNTVIAPKNWMAFRIGKEHPKGVMTPRFKWVNVLDAH